MSTLELLILILFCLMALVGGKAGIKSFLSIVLNTLLLLLVALFISWGINIMVLTLIFVPLKLATIIYLGTNDYTVAHNSFKASLLVCGITILIISLFEYLAQAYGFGAEAGEELIGLSQYPGLSYPQISITVAIFSALGAIAEAAVSIDSGLLEIYKHDAQISKATLLKAAANIGTDVLGTAVNTIVFGLFGSFLPLFIWFLRLKYSLGQVLNDKLFVNELLVIVYSLVGVLLIVPLSSYLLAQTMTKKEQSHEN